MRVLVSGMVRTRSPAAWSRFKSFRSSELAASFPTQPLLDDSPRLETPQSSRTAPSTHGRRPAHRSSQGGKPVSPEECLRKRRAMRLLVRSRSPYLQCSQDQRMGFLNIENAPGFLRTGRELIAPGEPKIIKERVISEGGWIERPGCRCFNLYKPPTIIRGNPRKADLWIEHRVWMQGRSMLAR